MSRRRHTKARVLKSSLEVKQVKDRQALDERPVRRKGLWGFLYSKSPGKLLTLRHSGILSRLTNDLCLQPPLPDKPTALRRRLGPFGRGGRNSSNSKIRSQQITAASATL